MDGVWFQSINFIIVKKKQGILPPGTYIGLLKEADKEREPVSESEKLKVKSQLQYIHTSSTLNKAFDLSVSQATFLRL